MKWEYHTETTYDLNDINGSDEFRELYQLVTNTFKQLGQEGWELVSVDNGIAYFKRAMPINTEQGGSAKFSYETCQNGYVIYDENNKAIPPYRLIEILIS